MVVILASLGTLFLDPSFTDTRISLPIGGLLTSVFLQQSYSSALPDVGYMVLMDKIYLLRYILISLIILKVILSGNRLIQRKTDPFSQKIKALDQRLALLFTAIYLSGILALVLITWNPLFRLILIAKDLTGISSNILLPFIWNQSVSGDNCHRLNQTIRLINCCLIFIPDVAFWG